MKLIIAEKPSLGRAIAEWLGIQTKHKGYIECKNGYTVTWLFGHLLELYDAYEYNPEWKSWACQLPIHPPVFKLKLRDDDGIRCQFSIMLGLITSCVEVINAGDPDREGQLLVDEVLEYANNIKPVNRLWLSAIDDKSIAKAFAEIKPNTHYHGYKLAAETRQQADWLIGINYTRAFTQAFQKYGYDKMMPIGRVQTPTLKLIVDRDNEIKNFKSKDYYTLSATFNKEIPEVKSRLIVPEHIKSLQDEDGRLLDKQPLQDIITQIANKQGIVANYTQQIKTTKQPLLYNLSTLQSVANKAYGLSAQQVLDATQLLYENKLTSYPRTDCQYMPESQYAEAQNILAKLQTCGVYTSFTPNHIIKSKVWDDKKVSAHHAIVPTGANLDNLDKIIGSLSDKKEATAKIFDLICLQYIAQFYPEFKYSEVEIIFEVGEYSNNAITKPYQFKTIGRTTIEQGWKAVITNQDNIANDKDKPKDANDDAITQELPVLTFGQVATCTKQELETKKTTKPKPYTEGTLIQTMSNIHNRIPELVQQLSYDEVTTKKLIKQYQTILKETAGLGTEATRASIIESLKLRTLIQTSGKNIISTELGQMLINSMIGDKLQHELAFLSSPLTTAEYEQYLDEIVGSSNINHQQTVANFWQSFTPSLAKVREFSLLQLNIELNKNSTMCPHCAKGNVYVALKPLDGKFGKYWKCQTCNSNLKDVDGKPLYIEKTTTSAVPAKATGEKCPECSRDLVERDGKFGKFIACSGYPNCKWTPPKPESAKPQPTDHLCTKCSSPMVLRESKDKTSSFLACSAYPKCKNTITLAVETSYD